MKLKEWFLTFSILLFCRVLEDSSDASATQHLMWTMMKSCIETNDADEWQDLYRKLIVTMTAIFLP